MSGKRKSPEKHRTEEAKDPKAGFLRRLWGIRPGKMGLVAAGIPGLFLAAFIVTAALGSSPAVRNAVHDLTDETLRVPGRLDRARSRFLGRMRADMVEIAHPTD